MRQDHTPPELDEFRDALWDYLLEHCDLLPDGKLFVKFHVEDRLNFENRLKGRWKYKYHRGDPRRTEQRHLLLRMKHRGMLKQREAEEVLRRTLARIGRINRRRAYIRKIKEAISTVLYYHL